MRKADWRDLVVLNRYIDEMRTKVDAQRRSMAMLSATGAAASIAAVQLTRSLTTLATLEAALRLRRGQGRTYVSRTT